ncbi:MAG TPA: tetratricopeptide repeat protein [Nitrospiraceae bacterium]|nr:tetratricopeptide repeat protein [Nitrospiraceae bacterium]
MKRSLPALFFFLVSVLTACGPDQATQWLETAQLEERQNNVAHAKQLYEDIVRQYPNSQAAQTARARLDALKNQ